MFVRRLSEQGGEGGKGPSPMEAAFLATLSSVPAPTPGGRRHSVVTISKVPKSSIVFGRNRRESFAAFPTAAFPPPGRFQRRDSSSSIARSPSISGSSFNLQLDIMDDIAEIKAARKVKLKMWQTDSEEKVCEVQPLDGGSTSRYHQKDSRRFSDITGSGQPAQPQPKRRASELPAPTTPTTPKKSGIVCSNSDLISIMSSLTSSAQEINNEAKPDTPTQVQKPTCLDQKRSRLKSNRSNSFDISLLPEGTSSESVQKTTPPGNWFVRRHLPIANKKYITPKSDSESPDTTETLKTPLVVTLTDEKPTVTVVVETQKVLQEKPKEVKELAKKEHKVVWDKPSGSVVDAQMLGSAIEVFLNQRGGEPTSTQPTASDGSSASKPTSSKGSWFGSKSKQDDDDVSCDNSICSTLKDLFVK